MLLAGGKTFLDRALSRFDVEESDVRLHGRGHIREHCSASGWNTGLPEEEALFVNGALRADAVPADILPDGHRWIVMSGDRVAIARLSAADIARLDGEADLLDFSVLTDIPRFDRNDLSLFTYLWDLIAGNAAQVTADFSSARTEPIGTGDAVPDGVHVIEPDRIAIDPTAVIKPGVVIDASEGPVTIGAGTVVMANSVIEGPCWIGPNCRIKIGAKIYEGTTIGPWCKIGGEVEGSIVLGYSNKQHDGFLGHSYLGSWVNLGADTNTSDLKNNYGSVRAVIGGEEIDSGTMFLGSLIGDHSKTGINTMLNTGTVIGVSANIFGGGFPAKSIPSFAWGGSDGFVEFRIDKAIELARTVTARRNVPFTDADERLLRLIHAQGIGADPDGGA